MTPNSQEAPQSQTETFTGKPMDYAKANKMDPTADVETRVPASQNDKGSS